MGIRFFVSGLVATGGGNMTETQLRKEVVWFSQQMEKQLKKNDHKTGWKNCKFTYLLDRLEGEYKELDECFWMPDSRSDMMWLGDDVDLKGKFTPEDAIKECADVANFAMMVADRLREKSND